MDGPRLLLLLALADYANDEGAHCYPSIKTLARRCRRSDRRTQALLRELAASGEIDIELGRGAPSAHGATNRYVLRRYREAMGLNPPPAAGEAGVSKPTGVSKSTGVMKSTGVTKPAPQGCQNQHPRGAETITPRGAETVTQSVSRTVSRTATGTVSGTARGSGSRRLAAPGPRVGGHVDGQKQPCLGRLCAGLSGPLRGRTGAQRQGQWAIGAPGKAARRGGAGGSRVLCPA